jgi:hypothetical protein
MYECKICLEHKDIKEKVTLRCMHDLCENCRENWEKVSESCPFCRTPMVAPEKEIEEWIFLDPDDWIVYSKTDMRYGEEKIYVYNRSDIQPSWRNDNMVIRLKRNGNRKRKIRNRKRS